MASVRETALTVLNKCIASGQYSNIALDTVIKREKLSDADRGLLTAMVYGTLETMLTLDDTLERLSGRSVGDMDLSVLNLLRMGIYQLAFLDRVPDHAAVNETVDLAPKKAKGFVNALLRAFIREGKRFQYPDVNADPVRYLSVRYSFSLAICERFVQAYGQERTEALLKAFCRPVPVTLRTNTVKISREEMVKKLRKAGAEAEPTPMSRSGIWVKGIPVTALPGFDEGEFFVQDEASQLCVEAVEAAPGMRVLDLCACPGSKSFGMALEMENQGSVLSCDLHGNKLSLVVSGAERLGIGIIATRVNDAKKTVFEWENTFDRVLCDVPCSGFGVFAKKPELRYKDPAQSDALPRIQGEILRTAAGYVKVGGRLIYSTCTLMPRENEENVQLFLGEHKNFTLLESRTLYPDLHNTDGFFYAVMQKMN